MHRHRRPAFAAMIHGPSQIVRTTVELQTDSLTTSWAPFGTRHENDPVAPLENPDLGITQSRSGGVFQAQSKRIPKTEDSLAEGDGFELSVPLSAQSLGILRSARRCLFSKQRRLNHSKQLVI